MNLTQAHRDALAAEGLDVQDLETAARLLFGAEAEELDPRAMLARLLPSMAARLEYLRRRKVEAPLSVSRLWRNPDAPCDQHTQVATSLVEMLTVCLGGNRSGKTHGALDADVAVALGRYHPHTQAWCKLNGIDPRTIPVGPGEVIVVAPSSGSSRRDHRPAIDARLPPGAEWYGRNSLSEAYVKITVPGHHQQATIWFKSVDQGPKSFKGSQARRIHIDEEPEGPEGRAVFEECLRAVAAVGGHVVITGTPQAGLTWMVEGLVQGKKHGAVTMRIDSMHNVFAPDPAALKRWLDGMDPDERAMRGRGEWVDRTGVVYPQWSRGAHYVPASEALTGYTDTEEPALTRIPDSWPRFRGMDFGQVDPTAIVWLALAPDGILHVYRCVRASGIPYEEWAEVIHEAEGATRDEGGVWTGHTEVVEACWGDAGGTAGREARHALALRDVPVQAAHKAVDTGLSAVRDVLRFRGDGRPGLYVHSDGEGTGMLVDEVEGYRYDPTSKLNKVLKVRDHLVDALRYGVVGVLLYTGGLGGGERARTVSEEERERLKAEAG